MPGKENGGGEVVVVVWVDRSDGVMSAPSTAKEMGDHPVEQHEKC